MIYQELEEGVQDPEGARGWISKKRDDLYSLGGDLTDREIYDYFIKCKIAPGYRLYSVIRSHCATVDFGTDLEELERRAFRKKFALQLSIFEDMVNYESKRKKFGPAEIYDGAIIPTTRNYNRIPGSRGSNPRPTNEQAQAKSKGEAKGTGVSRYTRELTGQKQWGITLARRITKYPDKKEQMNIRKMKRIQV